MIDADLHRLLAIGGGLVVLGGVALALALRAGLMRVERSGALFLASAFGLGVVAFAVKLAVIVALTELPDHALAALAPAPPLRSAPEEATGDPPPPAPTWRALPRQAPEPADNPTTPQKVELGRRLFLDARLSRDGTIACASCHDVTKGAGADGRSSSLGVGGAVGPRNAPTVYNAAFQARLFWDGRAHSLEEQAVGPMTNPIEMGQPSLEAVVRAVAADPSYRDAFARAFGRAGDPDIDEVAKAIAAFERTLITPDSPFDRFVSGDASALDAAQRRGMTLFKSLGCVVCHAGANFSGASLIDARRPFAPLLASGTDWDRRYRLADDKGAAAAQAADGLWRVPSLRNVELTGPYFHNGSVATLDEAVRAMAQMQTHARLGEREREDPDARVSFSVESGELSNYQRRVVSEGDVADIVAFLRSLTGDELARRAQAALTGK